MVEAIQILIAAIESSHLTDRTWVAWGERAMLESPSPPSWLVELYDAESAEEALAALYKGRNKQHGDGTGLDQSKLLLGFLYSRHRIGDINMSEFLHQAGELADARNYSNPDCEAIYSLLNEYERRVESSSHNPDAFAERVDSLFSSHADYAKQRLASLLAVI